MKAGIIRCRETESYCPMSMCIKSAKDGKGAFENQSDVEIVGVNSCGGCPGKTAALRAKEMVKRGADTIVLASCIKKGTPINFQCPNAEKIKASISNAIGANITILEYSH